MKSNCFLVAWNKYVKDESTWLSFRRSKYSYLIGKIPKPIRTLSLILLWPVFVLYVILHTLAFETWPHFTFSRQPAKDAEEFIPTEDKKLRYFPKIIFEGKIKPVWDKNVPRSNSN